MKHEVVLQTLLTSLSFYGLGQSKNSRVYIEIELFARVLRECLVMFFISSHIASSHQTSFSF